MTEKNVLDLFTLTHSQNAGNAAMIASNEVNAINAKNAIKYP